MKWPFFNKNTKPNEENNNKNDNEKINEAFFYQLNEMRKEDPLIGAKMGAKEIVNRLINGMKMNDPKGVHIESFLCILGSLAGYSCQAGLRREFIENKGLNENQVFTIVGDKDGNKYYFGDQINQPLVANQFSIWSLAAGAVQHLGIKEVIDIREVFEHVSKTVGSENFGIPRIPEGHKTSDIPYNYVCQLWPVLFPVAEQFCAAPNEWSIMFGMAVQEGIIMGKDALDPLFALSIVMESAIPMAKADFKSLRD